MSDNKKLSRRDFVRTTTAAGAIGVAASYVVPGSALGKDDTPAAGERIGVALIGCGGMGRNNLANCARSTDVVVRGACDVWKPRRDAVAEQYGPDCKTYADFREVLKQKDIDAVIVATPPHWHAMIAIAACEAGKDIYVKKPMTMHLGESLALKNAVKKHNVISQIGTQIHAGENYRRVVELVRAGNLGKISAVRTFNVMNQGPEGVGHNPDTTPPEGMDWDFWLGPAQEMPYNGTLAANSYNHCSWMITGGWTPGMAPHIIDLPIWALELGYPTNISASGGRYCIDDDGDAYDTHEVLWQYPKMTMTWMSTIANSYGFDFGSGPMSRRLGIYFHGVNGTMYCNYGMHEIAPEGKRMEGLATPEKSIAPSPGHEIEWIECIKTREQPSCSVSYHTKVDVPLVLSILSYKLGRSIRFDPTTEKIVGDPEAAKAAVPEYRAPWKFPAEYLS